MRQVRGQSRRAGALLQLGGAYLRPGHAGDVRGSEEMPLGAYDKLMCYSIAYT